ncbi:MAG: hypothetical protein IV100_07625, partial [Myxococcales bacterium]|nr:hypothetical protein [Myxococcales bacterium]
MKRISVAACSSALWVAFACAGCGEDATTDTVVDSGATDVAAGDAATGDTSTETTGDDTTDLCSVDAQPGTYCEASRADWCAWLEARTDVTRWKLVVTSAESEACVIDRLEAAGATEVVASGSESGTSTREVSAKGTWAQVGPTCRSGLTADCLNYELQLEFCGAFTTVETCSAQIVCTVSPMSSYGTRVPAGEFCREPDQFAVCLGLPDGCEGMESVYRSPAGECWKFNSQCAFPESWGKPLGGATLCPRVQDIDLLPICGQAFDFASYPVREDGPWKVGYRTTDVTYDPPGGPAGRTIQIHVWYPTTASEGEHPTWYGLFTDPVAVIDAPLAAVPWEDKWPVFVHSHGHQGFAGNSAFLHRYFASHGWIVAVPDHTGNTLGENLDPRPEWMYFVRSLDLSKTIDTFEAGFPGLGLPPEKLGTDKVLLGGHSYGVVTGWASLGATFASGAEFDAGPCADCTPEEKAAFTAGADDPRFVAGVLMAGSISRTWFGA